MAGGRQRPASAAVARHFAILTSLRWLPVGVVTPVVVLTATARGLSVADVGLVFSVQAVLVIALELPTGGLADSLGRRGVLLASAVLNVGALLLLTAVQTTAGFVAAFALLAVARALDSGPLEAWFVDALVDLGEGADPAVGLSRAGVGTGVALSVGALAGGLLPALSNDTLAVTFVAAAMLTVLQAGLVVAWVRPAVGAVTTGHTPVTLRAGLRDIPPIIAVVTRSARRDPALRLVLLLAFGTGVALGSLELLAPLRFAQLYGSSAEASRTYGLVVAMGFAAIAVGSGLAPTARRLFRGSTPWVISATFALGAVAMTGFALGSGSAALGAAFVAVYLATGLASPLRQQVLHSRTGSGQRATLVSAASLTLQVGGLLTNQAGPWLDKVAGPEAPFLVVAGILAALAVVATRLPPPATSLQP